MVRRIRVPVGAVLAAFFLLFFAAGAAAEVKELTVSLPKTVRGYEPCGITITSPAAGEAELKLYDEVQNVWLVRREEIREGENILAWDGLGAYGERLVNGPYRFLVRLKTAEGKEYAREAKFGIEGTVQTLVYALPSSDTLYLDKSEKWFVECFVTGKCLVAMEALDTEGNRAFYREEELDSRESVCVNWSGAVDEQHRIAPGEYTVRMWSKLNPDYARTFPLKVEENGPGRPEVAATGPVLPERGMSDAEVWEIMMKPSVVIDDNDTFRRFPLNTAPNTGSRAAGTLRCALQGLEVLETEGAWAHVKAWRHEDGQAMEGYYLLKKLTVYRPNIHYGVLIDKRDQTLTVYHDGEAVGTVPVSTGLAVPGGIYRETPAGAFLTDVHTGASFAQDGFRYEYPLRYDGGNYIHGAGYPRNGQVRDYSENQKLLGQKASHGCTRVSVVPEERRNLNMYWLWTHLPYHTRVVIIE